MQEIWKRLIYQGNDYGDFYEVSNLGRIRNSKTSRVRSQRTDKKGYYYIYGSLGSKNKGKVFKAHKAVAESFIPNPNNYPIVNHIDGNKSNNILSNLEWCTAAYNVRHAVATGLLTYYGEKPVFCKELDMKFKSLSEAARYLILNKYSSSSEHATKQKIWRVLKGQCKTICGGLTFIYL